MKVESVTLTVQDMATMLREAVRAKVGCEVAQISVVTKWPADSATDQMATILTISKAGANSYGLVRQVSVNLYPGAGATSHRWEEAS